MEIASKSKHAAAIEGVWVGLTDVYDGTFRWTSDMKTPAQHGFQWVNLWSLSCRKLPLFVPKLTILMELFYPRSRFRDRGERWVYGGAGAMLLRVSVEAKCASDRPLRLMRLTSMECQLC